MSTTITINNETTAKPQFPEKTDSISSYPDIRFYCPFCGSLDVYLNKNEQSVIMSVCCLDCEKKWRRTN